MADGFALSAVSYALRTRVERALRDYDVVQTGDFQIVSRPPEGLSTATHAKITLTLYPYHLTPNAAWEQSRRAAYDSKGVRKADPLLGLDVAYILAAYAPDGADAEAALGIAMLTLHETRTLTPAFLESLASGPFPATSPMPNALRQLAAQDAPIKVTPEGYDMEMASQLWSALNAGARTGLSYRVGTLLMERPVKSAPAPEIREARLSVVQIRRPQILSLSFAPATPANAPFTERTVALPGEKLVIGGTGLSAGLIEVMVGPRVIVPAAADSNDQRIAITLPADMRAGLQMIQVHHPIAKPTGNLPPPAIGVIAGERSNAVPIRIRPMLRASPLTLSARQVVDGVTHFTATLKFQVAVGTHQRAELYLDAQNPNSAGVYASYAFVAPVPAAGTVSANTTTRKFAIHGIAAGRYLVRGAIDGAESALTMGGSGYDGPLVNVPA